jgi:hypothetical protein
MECECTCAQLDRERFPNKKKMENQINAGKNSSQNETSYQ